MMKDESWHTGGEALEYDRPHTLSLGRSGLQIVAPCDFAMDKKPKQQPVATGRWWCESILSVSYVGLRPAHRIA